VDVRQGCLLVPSLFLFVEEAVNIATMHLLNKGELASISLLSIVVEQFINQYTSDVLDDDHFLLDFTSKRCM